MVLSNTVNMENYTYLYLKTYLWGADTNQIINSPKT